MRVITGSARGRKLKEPEGLDVRPTTDMVKEAMFDILQYEIADMRVLDLFAGTGQLGIEALSRGAKSAVFVDNATAPVRIIRENLEKTKLSGGTVVQADSIAFLKSAGQYDLIILDPPYDSGLLESALKRVKEFDKLCEGGIIVCETRAETAVFEPGEPFEKLKEYRYGKIKLTFFRRQPL